MVEKFTGYKASNGKSFDNEREAWGEELSILIAALADNDAITRKVVAGIMTNPHDIADVLVKLADMTETVAPPVPFDYRPANCRFRLSDEGQSFPKSSCGACGVRVGNGLGNSCSRMVPSCN